MIAMDLNGVLRLIFLEKSDLTVGVLIGFKMHGRFVFEHPGAHRFVQFALISIVLLGCSLGMQALARHWVNDYLSGALAACSRSGGVVRARQFIMGPAFRLPTGALRRRRRGNGPISSRLLRLDSCRRASALRTRH